MPDLNQFFVCVVIFFLYLSQFPWEGGGTKRKIKPFIHEIYKSHIKNFPFNIGKFFILVFKPLNRNERL